MERDLHYTVDEKQKSVLITEEGYEAAEDVLQVCAAQPSSLLMPDAAAAGTGRVLFHKVERSCTPPQKKCLEVDRPFAGEAICHGKQ